MQDAKQTQSTFMILVSSFIGICLSFKWLLHEINVVIILVNSNMEISWLLYIPLFVFITILLLLSFILFIGSYLEFKTKKFLKDSNLKIIFITTITFNITITTLIILNEYILKSIKYDYSGIFVLIFLTSIFLYIRKKYNIDIFYFLTMTVIISALFWGVIYILF
jgi:hypothetical protein